MLLSDFVDIIKQYDTVFLCETKLSDEDILHLPNEYTYLLKNRKKIYKKTRGLAIIYRKEIEQYINFIETKSDFIQWVQLSKEISCVKDDNLIIGRVYIPPKQSTYSSEEAFNELEDEIIAVSKNTKHIALVDDLNSKTSTVKDCIIPDQDLLQLLDFSENDELIKDLFDHENLVKNNVPLKGFSEDKNRPNKYGHKLIELCQNCSMYIQKCS